MGRRPYFLTFGGGSPRFRQASLRLALDARASRVFGRVRRFTDKSLNSRYTDFVTSHGDFVSDNPRGYGFWIWKPFLIRKIMSEMPPGDVLIYADAGCELNLGEPSARRRLGDYLALAQEQGISAFETDYPTVMWAKADLLHRFGVVGDGRWLGQIEANVLCVANTKAGRSVVEQWYETCCEGNYHLLDDTTSRIPETREFIEHRHDQAILSCVVRSLNLELLANETYFGPSPLSTMQEWLEYVNSFPMDPIRDEYVNAAEWFRHENAAALAQMDQSHQSRDWRARGAPFPIWVSRNISGLPVHRPGILGASSRKIRFMAKQIWRRPDRVV